jgi:GNAT superfamily N-acetyltransferase
MKDGVVVRQAKDDDVVGIREVFHRVYGDDYPYDDFFDLDWLRHSVHNDQILMLVAEDLEDERILGTASIVFDVSAHSDLTGELGRLAVLPEARGQRLGGMLMASRLEFARQRLHAVVVDNRTAHEFSQRISARHGLAPVGFLPDKFQFDERESIARYAMPFPNGLALRRNHPRIVPEAQALAHIALRNCGMEDDLVVDDAAPAYPCDRVFEVEVLTAEGMPHLLRIERGRVRAREIFGPVRAHYGFHQLAARHATYLIAREAGAVAGGIGFVEHEHDGAVQVLEAIGRNDFVLRFLFEALVRRCDERGVRYIEADVSAHAPRMQRTLVELGFLPAAYTPAAVFDEFERLDVLRLVRLREPFSERPPEPIGASREVADVVLRAFREQRVSPRIAAAIESMRPFAGLGPDQARRLAAGFRLVEHPAGHVLFAAGEAPDRMLILLEGAARIEIDGARVGGVEAGDCIGERSALTGDRHSATAVAREPIVAAVIDRDDLLTLVRRRPDIGVVLYRNLAASLGRKLAKLNAALLDG